MKNVLTCRKQTSKHNYETLNNLTNLKRQIMSFDEKFMFMTTNEIIGFPLKLQI